MELKFFGKNGNWLASSHKGQDFQSFRMRLFIILWEINGLNYQASNPDLGLMEHTLKGFRSKTFSSPALGGNKCPIGAILQRVLDFLTHGGERSCLRNLLPKL
jgi:hypothetical protein